MITIKEIFDESKKYFGSEVILGGWIKNLRNSKNVSFK